MLFTDDCIIQNRYMHRITALYMFRQLFIRIINEYHGHV